MHGDRMLTVRLRPVAESLAIEVEDTGVGIAADVLPRLFAFGFTTKKDGHGFGLHASANLAKELGGQISAHSDGPGRGARFTLRLPLAMATAAAERKQA
jgi:signal transduction histidine kinase